MNLAGKVGAGIGKTIIVMSALPVHQLPVVEPQESEVIYLVVPPAVTAHTTVARPYSLVEQLSLTWYNFKNRSQRASDKALALSFALFITAAAGIWGYNVKSAIGVDIFPSQHVENFAPIPGWQR
jgi:hypothetical protein